MAKGTLERLVARAIRGIALLAITATTPALAQDPAPTILAASPNPCVTDGGRQSVCVSTISWSGIDTHPYLQLWNQTGENLRCSSPGQSGAIDVLVRPGRPDTFRLYPATSCLSSDADVHNALANVTVRATTTPGTPDAAFVDVAVPELMVPGEKYTRLQVTMRNTGTMDWIGGRVSLDAVGIDGAAWTPARVFIPRDVVVLPGEDYTFVFSARVQPGKSIRLFSWKLRSVELQQYFGQQTPTRQDSHTWVVTDTPYAGPTPPTRLVTVWDYVIGDPTTKMCMTNPYTTICQTFYPQDVNHVLLVRDDTLNVKFLRNEALDTVGVLKDGTAPDVPSIEGLRCLTRTPGSCENGPLPSTPLVAEVPVLPASAINRHLVTEEGLDVQMKQTFWWNPINRDTCLPSGTAGSITGSSKLFLLDSYDFGGDVGVQQDVLVYEHLAGYPTDAPMAQLDPWGTKRLERYLFVEGKGFYQSDGIEDPDCRDTPSVQTCNGIFSRFISFEPVVWNRIEPTPVPLVEYCPNI